MIATKSWRLFPFVAMASLLAVVPLAVAGPPDTGSRTEVRRGDLTLSLDLDGTFVPQGAAEIRIRPKEFSGDLIVAKTSANGAKVAKGDVLLELDTKKIDRQIAAAKNDLSVALANLTKAQSDVDLGVKGDSLAMTNATDALANAQIALKRWDGPDGDAFIQSAKANITSADNDVENNSDELDQLHKMYKSEDLTSQTADIVMKRATRGLEMSKTGAHITRERSERTIEFEAVMQRQQLAAAVDQQMLAVDQLKAAQAQQQAVRQGALVSAQAAADEGQRKLDDLKQDRAGFAIGSPMDGVVVYGAFQGGWQAIDPSHFDAGEKVEADKVLMTVFDPAKVHVKVQCPESDIALLTVGAKVKVMPAALPGVSYDGVCGEISAAARTENSKTFFDVTVDIAGFDGRVAPGSTADVNLDGGTLHDVLLVPNSAISHGSVWISTPSADNKSFDEKPCNVVVGRTDGRRTEIKSGLQEGAWVLTQAGDGGQ